MTLVHDLYMFEAIGYRLWSLFNLVMMRKNKKSKWCWNCNCLLNWII